MPYQTTTLDDFITSIGVILDDTTAVYWTRQEIQFATYEALNVWGAYTSYWRTRGAFTLYPPVPLGAQADFVPSPVVSLPVAIPDLRGYSYTLDQMVREIQYMLLEAPNGLSGQQMSGQVTVGTILAAIQIARDRFVKDFKIPISIHVPYITPAPPDGLITLDQQSVFVHRASWMDKSVGAGSAIFPLADRWTTLWRQDAWAFDKGTPDWTTSPGLPYGYSEAELSPLKLQLVPPPVNTGVLEVLTVDSLQMDLTSPISLFNVPDEWAHAIKYAALADILSSNSQITDPLRADYAEQRYQQSLKMAENATSVIRLLYNGKPIPMDSITAIDAGDPNWRNRTGLPEMFGALYDTVIITPGLLLDQFGIIYDHSSNTPVITDNPYGFSVDVVQKAPLPTLLGGSPVSSNFIQVGPEDLSAIRDYVQHILLFKCGGNEFKSTMSDYDSFLKSVSLRAGVNKARITYLAPLFGQPRKESAERPDRMSINA